MKPQYKGKKQLHMRACKGRQCRNTISTDAVKDQTRLQNISVPLSAPFYLNEFLSAVKLRHQNALPISQPGEGHAELSRGPEVGVCWELLQQGVPHCVQQTEGRVENSQSVFSGLFRHGQNINTELF